MFFDRFQALCDGKGISVYRACTDIGLNRSAVAKWKAGGKPNGNTAGKLAAYLGVTTDYLLTGQEPVSAATTPEHTAVPEPSARPPLAPEDRELLQLIHDKPGLRIMFDASKKATNEDILKAVEIIKAFYGIKEDD